MKCLLLLLTAGFANAIVPEIAGLIETIKTLSSTSQLTTSMVYDQSGFTEISNSLDYSRGEILKVNFDMLVRDWLNDPILGTIPEQYKKVLPVAMKEYSYQLVNTEYEKQKYELSFNNGNGLLFMFHILLSPSNAGDHALRYEKHVLVSKFKAAAPYVLITESDCDLLGCDLTTNFVYTEAKINDAHIKTILDMNMRMLQEFNRKRF
ncbi:MAG: hypothetical protein Hyperionvirus6_69 [Hyperionvirus sp.]|uniref:Uncharacterized protein n=1 Tax=Hyperionvirus sp. TaxID=2487770 RepID=A0A3G5A862_9VIRU|nr:MAG: hypothetical protein Hyperionvirus6_69 [Hyperionvirus sp.]